MDSLTLDDGTEIYISPIEGDSPGRITARLRERATVAHMIGQIFGHGAQLTHDSYGAPILEGFSGVELSISHGAGKCVVAVRRDGVRIGVDIECWREQLTCIARRFLTPDEYDRYGDSPESLLRCWTAKEAVFKAAGCPQLTISAIEVTLNTDGATAHLLNPDADAPSATFTVTYLDHFPRLIAIARLHVP